MKPLKFSFALLFALISAGITVVTQASLLKGNRVTGCWSGIQLQDVLGNVPGSIPEPLYNNSSCRNVRSLIVPTANPQFNYVKAITANVTDRTNEGCTENLKDFCCLNIQEIINPTPQELSTVPAVDLGDGLKRYKILTVDCRP